MNTAVPGTEPEEINENPADGYRRLEEITFMDLDGSKPIKRTYKVGKGGVKAIGEHLPRGVGDVCFYDVVMDDSSLIRVMYPHGIVKFSKLVNMVLPEKKIIT